MLDSPEFICFVSFEVFINVVRHFFFFFVVDGGFESVLFLMNLTLISLLAIFRFQTTLSTNFCSICKLRWLLLKVSLCWRNHIILFILTNRRGLLLLAIMNGTVNILFLFFHILIKSVLKFHTIIALIFQ